VLAILWRKPWLFVLVPLDVVANFFRTASTTRSGDGAAAHCRNRRRSSTSAFRLVSVRPRDGRVCARRSSREPCRLAFPTFMLAGAIWSRVYVGVHWPLDVLGGAINAVWLLAA
jgi:hypothetical protein